MAKFMKKLLFWLFIILVIVVIGYLGVIAYTDANCSRGVNHLTSKYEIKSRDLTSIKYQPYIYEDIANCDSLWIKKCSDDKTLLYSYVLKTKDGKEIKIKEYKNKVFEDNFKEGKIRESYKEKLEINKNEEN